MIEEIKARFEHWDRIHLLKLFVIFLNVCLFTVGLLFIYIGFTEWVDFKYEFMSDIFYTVPVSCIIVGLLIFVAFGLCTFGVVQEKLPCIVIYAALLCICSTVEFGSSYLVKDFKEMGDGAKATIQTSFEWLIEEYDPTTGMETLDILQPMLKCCGVDGHEDWTYDRVPQRLIDLGYWANPLYPHSCCEYTHERDEQFCVHDRSLTDQWIHPIGCREAFTLDLQLKSAVFTNFAKLMGILQLVIAAISVWLAVEIKIHRVNEAAFQIYCKQNSKQQKFSAILFSTKS